MKNKPAISKEQADKNYQEDADKERAITIAASALTQEQLSVNQLIGKIQATNFFKKIGNVTEIKLFSDIKNNKQYKDLSMIGASGQMVTVTTWSDFCQQLGYSREKIDQDILNLSTFGEEFLESSQQMGLGYRDLRKLRQLPDDDREVVINEVEVNTGDKEAIVEIIDDLSAKHVKEKTALKTELKEAQENTKADSKIIEKKNQTIDDLQRKLEKKQQANPQQKAIQHAEDISKLSVEMLSLIGRLDNLFDEIASDDELPPNLEANQVHSCLEAKQAIDGVITKYQLQITADLDDALDWVADAKSGWEAEKGELNG